MNIFVTGASGFIGKSICRSLIEEGHKVVGCTRRIEVKQNELHQGVIHHYLDLNQPIKDLTPPFNIDIIIHTAGVAHNKSNQPEDYYRVNKQATIELAKLAIQLKVKKFIFLSSISVFGQCKEITDSTPKAPINDYGKSKLAAEEAIKRLINQGSGETTFVTLRPPLVYGENAPGNLKAIEKVLKKGIPLPLAGIPNRRTFLSLENLESAIKKIISNEKMESDDFNISDEGLTSSSHLIQHMINHHWKKGFIFKFPTLILRIFLTCLGKTELYEKLFSDLTVSNLKLKKALDWKPKTINEVH